MVGEELQAEFAFTAGSSAGGKTKEIHYRVKAWLTINYKLYQSGNLSLHCLSGQRVLVDLNFVALGWSCIKARKKQRQAL